MKLLRGLLVLAGSSIALLAARETEVAQKSGGVLKIYHRDSPASMSIHEEGTISTVVPMMGVFNNLEPRRQKQVARRCVVGWAQGWAERHQPLRPAETLDLRRRPHPPNSYGEGLDPGVRV
jgi:hypothetical protein